MPNITLTIDDESYSDFKEAFIKQHPIPTDDEGEPLFSENAWIKEKIRRIVKDIYMKGKGKLVMEEGSYQEDIVQ